MKEINELRSLLGSNKSPSDLMKELGDMRAKAAKTSDFDKYFMGKSPKDLARELE